MTAEEFRELRVKIGAKYHQKLHILKALRRKSMAEAIEEALDLYFLSVLDERPAGEEASA